MRGLLAAAIALTCGCKDKQQQAPAAAPPAITAAPPAEAPARQAPREPGKPVSVAEATALLPKLTGTQIIAPKQTRDGRQVHGTWCIDGTSADDVARQVGQLMEQAKFANVSVRGNGRKAGVAGDRDGMRMSMVVSASAAQVCAAPAHYFASATIYRP